MQSRQLYTMYVYVTSTWFDIVMIDIREFHIMSMWALLFCLLLLLLFHQFFSSVLSFDMLKAHANNRNLYAVGCFSSLPVTVVVLRMLHDTTTNPITWTYIIYGYTVYSIHLHGINVEIMYVNISGCRGPYSLHSPHMQKYTPSISHFISNWKDELYCGGPEKSYQVRQTISLPLTTTTKP